MSELSTAVHSTIGSDEPAGATASVLFERPADESCPVERAVEQLADKWKLRILIALANDRVVRFNELQRRITGISPKVLTTALRELQADGLIERTMYNEMPPRVEYRPTPRSQALLPILAQLQTWARES